MLRVDQEALVVPMRDLNISDKSVFEDWLREEKAYLSGLKREPQEETLQMEYWQALVNLSTAEYVLFAYCRMTMTNSSYRQERDVAWNTTTTMLNTPTTIAIGQKDPTRVTETARRHAQEKVSKRLEVVQSLELRLEISERWAADSVEWQETARMVVMRKYQRALDHLEGLIVARMFEMTKVNRAQTGTSFGSHWNKFILR